jgi:hypothetical protein
MAPANVARYRFLNQPWAAESICLDVLAADPDNQQALVILILALTDQFGESLAEGVERARALLPRLRDAYKRAYYAGIICERRGRAQLHRHTLGAVEVAAEWFREAMTWYEKAEALRSPGNDESILRWNTCVRMLARHERAHAPGEYEPVLGE